jgi:DNA-binding MarR family transcriptional regulator
MRRSPADLSECAGCACFAVRRAARAITQHYDRALRPTGLRATQFTLLTVLSLGGPLPLSRVATRLGMERTTLTRNLKRLLTEGLIAVSSGGDRRVRTIAITPKGRRQAAAAVPYWRGAQRAAASYLPASTFDSLYSLAESLSTGRARSEPDEVRVDKETRK